MVHAVLEWWHEPAGIDTCHVRLFNPIMSFINTSRMCQYQYPYIRTRPTALQGRYVKAKYICFHEHSRSFILAGQVPTTIYVELLYVICIIYLNTFVFKSRGAGKTNGFKGEWVVTLIDRHKYHRLHYIVCVLKRSDEATMVDTIGYKFPCLKIIFYLIYFFNFFLALYSVLFLNLQLRVLARA